MLLLLVGGPAGAQDGDQREKDQPVSVKAYGAVGDGEHDDTAAIQSAVNDGVGGVRLPRGTYRITEPIVVELDEVGFTSIVSDGTATLVMEGSGPALKIVGTHSGTAAPRTVKPNVWERQRSPLVDGIEIVGRHDEADGIEATGTMQLTITRCTIRKARHGVRLAERNRNVIISNSHIYENTGVGIYYDAVNLHQSNIVGCHVSYNEGGGIVVRGGDVRNVHIGTCDIEANMGGGGPNGEGTANVLLDARGGSIGEAAVVGCTIQHTHNAPNSANVRIIGLSSGRDFTEERRHGNFTVADNVLSDVRYNVDVQDARAVTVTGNTMWKGYDRDLWVRNSDSIVVADNVFDRNPRYHYGDGSESQHGLLFVGCDGGTISGNTIRGTGDVTAALVLRDCSRMNVTGCTLLDYQNGGLLLESVTNSRVSDCIIRDDREGAAETFSLKVIGESGGNLIADNLLTGSIHIPDGTAGMSGNQIDR